MSSSRLSHLRRASLLATSAITCIMLPAEAVAQDASNQGGAGPAATPAAASTADNANEIVVTGIRRSIATAQETKRTADTFVD